LSAIPVFLFNLDNDLLEAEVVGVVALAKAGDTGVCDRGEESLRSLYSGRTRLKVRVVSSELEPEFGEDTQRRRRWSGESQNEMGD